MNRCVLLKKNASRRIRRSRTPAHLCVIDCSVNRLAGMTRRNRKAGEETYNKWHKHTYVEYFIARHRRACRLTITRRRDSLTTIRILLAGTSARRGAYVCCAKQCAMLNSHYQSRRRQSALRPSSVAFSFFNENN